MNGGLQIFNIVRDNGKAASVQKLKKWQAESSAAISRLSGDQQKDIVKQFLILAADIKHYQRLQVVSELFESLVTGDVLPARMVCESILRCDKLVYELQDFWVECFALIYRIIGRVDRKGIQGVIKGCIEKAQTIPAFDFAVQPQLKVLEHVFEKIFDRNACLLPGHFILTEIQRVYPASKNWPHRRLAQLMSSFVESFRPVAQMVSIIGHSRMLPVVGHTRYAEHLINPWRLDPATLKFSLKGNLPYDAELLKPQTQLLRYVLQQPYSRDMVCSMLGLPKQRKQRCVVLEEQMVELVILAMERSENDTNQSGEGVDGTFANHWTWLHLSSQLIYFCTYQYISLPTVVVAIHDKLLARNLRKGRDNLMWFLLHFVSGIQQNPLSNFLPVLLLYDLLYPEDEPLPVPDYKQARCTHQLAAASIWIQLRRKARLENEAFPRSIPVSLKLHQNFLLSLARSKSLNVESDYRMALLWNAHSTDLEVFEKTLATLFSTAFGSCTSQQHLESGVAPISMAILDSLTAASKIGVIQKIVLHLTKLAESRSDLLLAPALVETYARLLVYTAMESVGIKSFVDHVLPTVVKYHAWRILHALLEMLTYRVHHTPPNCRMQLVCHLHRLAALPEANSTQLHLSIESAALKVIMGLRSTEVQSELFRCASDLKTLVSAESEEFNRALILTLARSIQVTSTGADSSNGTWCKELLFAIMQVTPHSWANHTLQFFPPVLRKFFLQIAFPHENKQRIKRAVEEEYYVWQSMSTESDIITHFSRSDVPPVFLCILFKMIFETDRVNPVAYKILERIGARALSAHLRQFCDYLVFEFANSAGGQHVNRCITTVNRMMWKYNVITIDRLVLCMALRPQEGGEAQVCFFIIQMLLVKATEFRSRVQEFVKENSPEHWKQSNWHQRHLTFHRQFPETFAPECVMHQIGNGASQYQNLPTYFGNVCLRFLPVFDILIHRYLEISPVNKNLEVLLQQLGCLYKFHDRPITYLYNTLHYYDRKLRDAPRLRKKLAVAVLGSLTESRAPGLILSGPFFRYIETHQEIVVWVPDLGYYMKLIRTLVETMKGNLRPLADWRFSEFPNAATHVLYVTCVELMTLHVPHDVVTSALLDVVAKGYSVIPPDDIHSWINCVGLVMGALPECYWTAFLDRLTETVSSPGLAKWQYNGLTPFQVFSFETTYNCLLESKYSYVLALAHSVWHHAKVCQIATLPQFVREKLQPAVTSEEQFIFACHLIGPTLARLKDERPGCVAELSMSLLEMLEQLDRTQLKLNYLDIICNLLYHIKYMCNGYRMKADVECIVKRLRPRLQAKLRFITEANVEEIQID